VLYARVPESLPCHKQNVFLKDQSQRISLPPSPQKVRNRSSCIISCMDTETWCWLSKSDSTISKNTSRDGFCTTRFIL